MIDLLWLLLPVAACSGWMAANKKNITTKYFDKDNSNNNFKFNQKYISGLNFVLNDETDKAIDVFLELFSVDNDTVETHMALGSLFRRRGEVERALRVHQNIIARPSLCSQQRLSGMLELGYDYLCAGVLDRAENIFKDIIKHYPYNPIALKHLLDIYQRQRDWYSAIEIALLLQKNTHHRYAKNIAHYYCELAQIKREQGSYNDANFYVRQALKFQDDSIRANLLLANLYITNEQIKKGLKIYYNLVESNQGYLDIVLPLLITTSIRYNYDSNLTRFIGDLARNNLRVLTIPEVIMFLLETKGYEYTWQQVAQASEDNTTLNLLFSLIKMIGESGFVEQNNYFLLNNCVTRLLAQSKNYSCSNCGFIYSELLWLCPSCKSWDTVQHVDFCI